MSDLHKKVLTSIVDACHRGGASLSEKQRALIAGALIVWLDVASRDTATQLKTKESTDTDLLSWLEANLPHLGAIGRSPSGDWQMFDVNGHLAPPSGSLRELILAAINKSPIQTNVQIN